MEYVGEVSRSFPWRAIALVAGFVAAVELVALLALAGVQLVPSGHSPSSPSLRAVPAPAVTAAAATSTPAAATTATAAPAKAAHAAKPQPLRPRSKVAILVLNGNGISGAAGAEAQRLLGLGYGAATSTNAPSHSYAHSIVLFTPGYEREGKRLAHDAGITIVGPLDGLTPSQVKGSQLVVILGDS